MNFTDIIKALGGNRKLARELSMMRGEDVTEHRVQKWKARNSIPAEYWLDFVTIAADAGMSISPSMLAQTARNRSLQ